MRWKFWKKKVEWEIKPVIEIKTEVKPIKLKKGQKLILIAGERDDAPSMEQFEEMVCILKEIEDQKTLIMPCAIRAYIVDSKEQIGLYKGDKTKYECE